MNLSTYLPFLVDLMIKSTVLLGLALAAAWGGRRASAANRHLIWMAAFGALLVLPITTAWRSLAGSERAGTDEAGTVIVLKLPAGVTPPISVTRMEVATAPVLLGRAVMQWARENGRIGVVTVWLGVTGLLLGWRMVGAGRLRWLRRRSDVVSDVWIEAWALRITVEQGLRRRVELRTSALCPVAMTWGTLRPVVMLPAEATRWSAERLEWVLRHELAHVARWDCLVRLGSQVACALYWPNPLVWLGARRLRLAQEQACDDRVLTAGAEARGYAAELLAGARALAGRERPEAALAMAEPSTLEKRIVGIVDEGRNRSGAGRRASGLAMVAAGLALVGCTSLQVEEAREAQGVRPVPTAAEDARRQVEISARFIQFKSDAPEAKAFLKELEGMPSYVSESRELIEGLSPEAASELINNLKNRVAAELVGAPKITILNGNRARISIVQELRYPAVGGKRAGATQEPIQTHAAGATMPGFGLGGAVPATVGEDGMARGGVVITPGTPADFAASEVGIELDVLPHVVADGKVALELEARITEFEGFVEFAPQAQAPAATNFQPIFSKRKVRVDERIKSGQAMVFQLGRTKHIDMPMADGSRKVTTADPDAAADQIVLVVVTATEITPAGSGTAARPRAATEVLDGSTNQVRP